MYWLNWRYSLTDRACERSRPICRSVAQALSVALRSTLRSICITVPHFVPVGQTIVEMWPFFDSSRCWPSAIRNFKCWYGWYASLCLISCQSSKHSAYMAIFHIFLGRLFWVDLIKLVSNVHPTKCFFNFNEIWHVVRGRWVMHDSM